MKILHPFVRFRGHVSGLRRVRRDKHALPLVLLLILLAGTVRPAMAQCPPVKDQAAAWEAAELDAEQQDAVLRAIRQTLDRYCEIADLYDHGQGIYSEDKGREFLELLGPSQRIFDDLQLDGGGLTPAQYRDKAYKYFYNTGLQFRLEDPLIGEVRRNERYLMARILLRKEMFNGLDSRYRYRDLSGRPRSIPLVMEMRLDRQADGAYRAYVYAIDEAVEKVTREYSGRYLDIQIGGLADMGTGWQAAEPWTALDLPRPQHRAFQVEGLYSAPFGGSERWYWSAGLGLRNGNASLRLDEALRVQFTQQGRDFGQGLYSVPFTRYWEYGAGSEIWLSYTAAFVPLGVRFNLRPDFRKEWLFDLHVLPGLAMVRQDYEGDIALAYGYGGHLDCIRNVAFRRGDARSGWMSPMFNLRFSPGYYGSIASWGRSNRNVGWFLRADLEMALLPLIQREGDAPWISLESQPDGQGLAVINDDAAILHRTQKPLLIGLRGGIFWKFF